MLHKILKKSVPWYLFFPVVGSFITLPTAKPVMHANVNFFPAFFFSIVPTFQNFYVLSATLQYKLPVQTKDGGTKLIFKAFDGLIGEAR